MGAILRILAGLLGRTAARTGGAAAARAGAQGLGRAAGGQTAKSLASSTAPKVAQAAEKEAASEAADDFKRRAAKALEAKLLGSILQKLGNSTPGQDKSGAGWGGNVSQLLANRLAFLQAQKSGQPAAMPGKPAPPPAPPASGGFKVSNPTPEHRKAVELWLAGKGPQPEPGQGVPLREPHAPNYQAPDLQPLQVNRTGTTPGTTAAQPPARGVFRSFFPPYAPAANPQQPPAQPVQRGFFPALVQRLNPFSAREDRGQQREVPTGGGFAALAAQSRNFGPLLAGSMTQHDVTSQAEREDQQQREAEAHEAGVDALKKLTAAATGSATALLLTPPAIKKFSEAMLSSKQHLADFNADIAAAFARDEARNIYRSRESGAAQSGTTTELADAVGDMRDSTRLAQDAYANATNRVLTLGARLVELLATTANNSAYMRRLYEYFISDAPDRRDPFTEALFQQADMAAGRQNFPLPGNNRGMQVGGWDPAPQPPGRENPPLPVAGGQAAPGGGFAPPPFVRRNQAAEQRRGARDAFQQRQAGKREAFQAGKEARRQAFEAGKAARRAGGVRGAAERRRQRRMGQ